MGRAPVIVAIGVCCVTGIVPAAAQPPAADGWVVLPVDEYRTLRERSLGLPAPPAASPVDATLTRVDYDLRVEDDAIAGRALLTIDVLRDGWARVAIPAGLMVRERPDRWTAGGARRGAAAARAAVARGPRRARRSTSRCR